MLRSLKIFETNSDGTPKVDEEGQTVRLPEAKQRPKTRKEMSAGELRYLDERAPMREEDMRRRRDRFNESRNMLRALTGFIEQHVAKEASGK